MRDELGERIKGQYEHRTRTFVPRRTFSIIRLDGKAFHTYTSKLLKPFDHNLYTDINDAVIALLPHIQGAVFAYTQSDEISVLVTDFNLPTTSAWFDGNIQKIASVSASIITAEFNKLRWLRRNNLTGISDNIAKGLPTAYFDSRVFTIPDRTEVMNYFIWRNQDCSRNSVSMLAQDLFSHKELQGKSTTEMIEMTKQHNGGCMAWPSLNQDLKFGRLIVKETYISAAAQRDPQILLGDPTAERTRWVVKPAWRFTEDKEKLTALIPQYT
jgi:tRNA(His) 5'-end guanylyltransferase